MRFIGILCLMFSAVLLMLGCGTSSSPPDAKSKAAIAKEKIGEAAEATAEAAKAEWEKYTLNMNKQLNEFDAKCKQLAVRITKAEGQAKKDLEKTLEVAKVKRDAAARKLDELKDAGVARWEKVKEGAGNALDDLKKVFD